MNKMKELAELLGVELGEEFEISGVPHKHRITEERMEIEETGNSWGGVTGSLLYDVLIGKRRIIKKSWKPKDNEIYWRVTYGSVAYSYWSGSVMDFAFYAVGNCFRTEEEAKAHRDEVISRLKKIYDDGKPLMGAEE